MNALVGSLSFNTQLKIEFLGSLYSLKNYMKNFVSSLEHRIIAVKGTFLKSFTHGNLFNLTNCFSKGRVKILTMRN